ncbi:MAG: 30S ribosomal protein S12 methylthiotransferase RimO [Verrucomicrobiota bacterium]|jgi:ribosomal protein S12 methylthiotransferase
MKKSSHRPVRVGLISLGCAKNLVDAEIMLGSLLQGGMEITNDAERADVLIVNTCSFIEAAQKESVEAILEAAQARAKSNPGRGLIVSGCLPQRFRDDLPKLLPEVDAFMGIDQVAQVAQIVRQALARRRDRKLGAPADARRPKSVKTISKRLAAMDAAPPPPPPPAPLVEVHSRPTYIPDFATPRFRLTPRHFAYLKIAEGCNHPCSFCIIPRMRGAYRSRPQADILQEARQLLAAGVRELNLISQDSTYYGLDLRAGHSRTISSPEKFQAAARALPAGAATLATLLPALNGLPGDFWIRLLYTHPAHWTDGLIAAVAQCPKVARYIDLPLQHIHELMLERMRRETSRKHIIDLIAKIRAGVPGVALRTTFIVGFPGETEACFQSLLEFIRAAKFERLGVFTYSPQEGTRAGKMEAQIPERVKKRRQALAMAEQLKVARQISASFVGREITVLVEAPARPADLRAAEVSSWEHGLIRSPAAPAGLKDAGSGGRGDFLIARGQADAPDIDGRVYVRGKLPLGEFARVKIIGHTDYDLIAEPVAQILA